VSEVLGRAGAAGVEAMVAGEAGGTELHADGSFRVPLADAEHAWRDAIPRIMAAAVDVG
jgi:hypothetical protein